MNNEKNLKIDLSEEEYEEYLFFKKCQEYMDNFVLSRPSKSTTREYKIIKKAVKEWGIPFEVKSQKPSKELFLETLNSFPECDKEESEEIINALNSMSEEDKKIVNRRVVKL